MAISHGQSISLHQNRSTDMKSTLKLPAIEIARATKGPIVFSPESIVPLDAPKTVWFILSEWSNKSKSAHIFVNRNSFAN